MSVVRDRNIRCDYSPQKCFCKQEEPYAWVRVDHNLKMLYYEVPRAASSSIVAFLDRYHDFKQLSVKEYHELILDYDVDLNEYFKFSVARHPMERLGSVFLSSTCYDDYDHFKNQSSIYSPYDLVFSETPSFKQFIKTVFNEGYIYCHILPCSRFYSRVFSMDTILYVEDLKNEFNKKLPFRKTFDIWKNSQKHRKKTLGKYVDFYYGDDGSIDNNLIEKISDFYKEDFQLHPYSIYRYLGLKEEV